MVSQDIPSVPVQPEGIASLRLNWVGLQTELSLLVMDSLNTSCVPGARDGVWFGENETVGLAWMQGVVFRT